MKVGVEWTPTRWRTLQTLYRYLQRGPSRSRYSFNPRAEILRARWLISSQVLELLSYITRNRSDEERAAFVAPFQNALKSGDGRKPIDEDENRRKLILSKLVQEIRGLGDGSDKGALMAKSPRGYLLKNYTEVEGFYNLIFAHIFNLYPASSPEAKQYVTALLKVISTSTSDRLSVKYRMCVSLVFVSRLPLFARIC